MPKIQPEDKTQHATFPFSLRVDVYAQILAYGAFLSPESPSSKDYVVTELFRESVKGDKEFWTFWEQNKTKFVAEQVAQLPQTFGGTATRGRSRGQKSAV